MKKLLHFLFTIVLLATLGNVSKAQSNCPPQPSPTVTATLFFQTGRDPIPAVQITNNSNIPETLTAVVDIIRTDGINFQHWFSQPTNVNPGQRVQFNNLTENVLRPLTPGNFFGQVGVYDGNGCQRFNAPLIRFWD